MMEGPWCRFRREARARERHRHCSRGWPESAWPQRPIREAATPVATVAAAGAKAGIGKPP